MTAAAMWAQAQEAVLAVGTQALAGAGPTPATALRGCRWGQGGGCGQCPRAHLVMCPSAHVWRLQVRDACSHTCLTEQRLHGMHQKLCLAHEGSQPLQARTTCRDANTKQAQHKCSVGPVPGWLLKEVPVSNLAQHPPALRDMLGVLCCAAPCCAAQVWDYAVRELGVASHIRLALDDRSPGVRVRALCSFQG